jgi:hypothetical protein
MKKFVKNRGDLVPFVYNGNVTQRLGLRKELLTEIRNIKGGLISEEIFQFGPNHPNYCSSTFHLKNNEEHFLRIEPKLKILFEIKPPLQINAIWLLLPRTKLFVVT